MRLSNLLISRGDSQISPINGFQLCSPFATSGESSWMALLRRSNRESAPPKASATTAMKIQPLRPSNQYSGRAVFAAITSGCGAAALFETFGVLLEPAGEDGPADALCGAPAVVVADPAVPPEGVVSS